MYFCVFVIVCISVFVIECISVFLNQARTGHRPVRTWFLEIVSVRTSVCAFACVCPPPRLLITSGLMWCDMDPI